MSISGNGRGNLTNQNETVKAFTVGKGFVNGAGKGFVNGAGKGFVNGAGKGFVNGAGKGFVNGTGKGFVNGAGKGFVNGAGKGFVNGAGRGYVNGAGKGFVNGAGRGYVNGAGRGYINGAGRGMVNGNGLVNGFGKGGAVPTEGKPRSSRRLKGMMAALVIIALISVPLGMAWLNASNSAGGIKVDRDFSDWNDVEKVQLATSCPDANIDLSSCAASVSGGTLHLYASVKGTMFAGGEDGMTDMLSVFVDADRNSNTGYRVGGIGADDIVILCGADNRVASCAYQSYDDSRDSTGLDWNAWKSPMPAKAAVKGGQLELELQASEPCASGTETLFHFQNHDGVSDVSETVIGAQRGTLIVKETPAGSIITRSAGTKLLTLELAASGRDIKVTEISLAKTGTADIGSILINGESHAVKAGTATITFEPALLVRKGTSVKLEIGADTSGAVPSSSLGIGLSSARNVRVASGAVTLLGTCADSMAYIQQAPASVVIDGAFADWGKRQPATDDAKGDSGNAATDITRFASESLPGRASFYFRVDGSMMAGESVPVTAPKVASPTKQGSSDPVPSGTTTVVSPSDIQAPPLLGEDVARILIDTDRNPQTGYNPGTISATAALAGAMRSAPTSIGADVMVEIKGKNGIVFSKTIFKFAGASQLVWSWTPAGEADVASDSAQLETGIDLGAIGVGTVSSYDAYISISDWNGIADVTEPIPAGASNGGRYFNDKSQLAFASGFDAAATTDDINGIVLADLDNDGDLDIATAGSSGETNEVQIWQNDGSPFSGTWTSQAVGSSSDSVFAIAAGDLDNDGDIDLVTGSGSSEDYEVIAWQSDGSPFDGGWTANDVGTISDNVYSVALADLDYDGYLDIATGGGTAGSSGPITVWQNDGSPFSLTWTSNSVGSLTDCVYGVAISDLDGDGYLDLACVNRLVSETKTLTIWQGDKTPFTDGWKKWDVASTSSRLTCIAAGDLDNDGYVDLATGTDTGDSIATIYVWQSDGTPFDGGWKKQGVALLDDKANSIKIADLDHDGLMDLVTGTGVTENYEVIAFPNNGKPFGGKWAQSDIGADAATDGIFAVAIGDVDNDGDLDIITGSDSVNEDYELIAWKNTLTHRNMPYNSTANSAWEAGEDVRGMATADFDRNGKLDVVMVADTSAGYEVEVLSGGSAPFSGVWSNNSMQVSDNILCVAAADFDNDGWVDIVTGSASSATTEILLWENDGTPFKDPWLSYDVCAMTDDVRSIAAADFDNDGWTDIVTGSYYTQNHQINVFENDGTPFDSIWTMTEAGLSYCTAASLAVADFDNDGWTDIAVGTLKDNSSASLNKKIKVFENDGTPFDGLFTAHDVADADDVVNGIVAADLDNDGWPDLATASGALATNEVMVWENDGAPWDGWGASNGIGSTGVNTYGIAAGDADNDGRIDLVTGSAYQSGEDEVIIWRNSDSTPFVDAWTKNGVGDSTTDVTSVAFGDLDGDGDLDVMSGSLYSSSEYEVLSWENLGAQATVTVTDTSPSSLLRGNADDFLRITVTHNGISGDDDIELAKLRVHFHNGGGYLTDAQMDDTFTYYNIYIDGGNGIYDGSDTKLTTSYVRSNGFLTITFDDPDSVATVTAGNAKTYFLVLTTSSGGTLVTDFYLEFDPDGFTTSDYNEYENAASDTIVSIKEAAMLTTAATTLQVPEFQDMLLPLVGSVAVFAFLRRGRKSPLRRRKDRKA